MKIQKTDSESFDITDEQFIADIKDLYLFGIPEYDKRNKTKTVKFTVRPAHHDQVSEIREKLPDSWFNTRTSIDRAMYVIGVRTTLEVMEKVYGHDVQRLKENLMGMCLLAREERRLQLEKEMELFKQSVWAGPRTNDEKIKVVQLYEHKYEKAVAAMYGKTDED